MKKKTWIIVAAAVVLVLIFCFIFIKPAKGPETAGPQETPPIVSAPIEEPQTPAAAPEEEKPKLIESPLGEFNPESPEKTAPLAPEKVAEVINKSGVIEITMSPAGISPSEFTVKAGETVSLVIRAVRDSYVFKFKDSGLANLRSGVSIDETRGISFIAPTKRGDYIFIRERPGFEDEVNPPQGVMRVK